MLVGFIYTHHEWQLSLQSYHLLPNHSPPLILSLLPSSLYTLVIIFYLLHFILVFIHEDLKKILKWHKGAEEKAYGGNDSFLKLHSRPHLIHMFPLLRFLTHGSRKVSRRKRCGMGLCRVRGTSEHVWTIHPGNPPLSTTSCLKWPPHHSSLMH